MLRSSLLSVSALCALPLAAAAATLDESLDAIALSRAIGEWVRGEN